MEKKGKEKAISPVRLSSVSEDEGDCVVVSVAAEDKEEAPQMRKEDSITIDDEDTEGEEEEEGDLGSEDEHTVRLRSAASSSTYTLPGEIAKMLYPHQREGLKWLWALHCNRAGGILGDDMGLGKTMQVIAKCLCSGIFLFSTLYCVVFIQNCITYAVAPC